MKIAMTRREVKNAMRKHKYIIMRTTENGLIGYNCAAVLLRADFSPGNARTRFIGFWPCGFQEYITHKVPFIK